MEHQQIFGTSFECDCKKNHQVPTKLYIYGEDALDRLAANAGSFCDGDKCLILADARTYEVAGKKVGRLLESRFSETVHFIVPDSDGKSPVTDDTTKDSILAAAPEVDLFVAVGSGVISDLTKWVAFLRKKPYIMVPTAASMNGYASANVAATIDGLKMLFHANACLAVFADPKIIMNAPYELTVSGLGDVVAKPVSSADWKLNHFLFNEYYCQFAVDLLKDIEPKYLENPEGIRQKHPGSFQALFEALLYSSIAMTITGTSSPASGGEHLISHTIDMISSRDGKTHDLHGRQVGVASVLMAALYEKIMAIDTPLFKDVPKTVNQSFWGTLTPMVAGEYEKKWEKFEKAKRFLSQPDHWLQLKALIKPHLIPAQKLKTCLRKAGGAHRYWDIRIDHKAMERADFLAVAANANQMRQRFTVLDLGLMLGIGSDELSGLIDEWVAN